MTTSSMSSPSLTLVKIMLLLKIVSLSFMHTVQPAQQVSDSRLRQLSDSCPTVSDSRPTVVRQSSDSQDGARAPSQSDSRPTVVRQSDSCPTVTSDSVRQFRQFFRQFRQFRQPGLSSRATMRATFISGCCHERQVT